MERRAKMLNVCLCIFDTQQINKKPPEKVALLTMEFD